MSKREPARLSQRINNIRKAITALPPVLTPQASALAIGQIQNELGEIFAWSVDVENFIATFEKQIAALNDAVEQILIQQEGGDDQQAQPVKPFDAMAAVDDLLKQKATS